MVKMFRVMTSIVLSNKELNAAVDLLNLSLSSGSFTIYIHFCKTMWVPRL